MCGGGLLKITLYIIWETNFQLFNFLCCEEEWAADEDSLLNSPSIDLPLYVFFHLAGSGKTVLILTYGFYAQKYSAGKLV